MKLASIIFFGIWRAVLSLPDGDLPFSMNMVSKNNRIVVEIINGSERITVDEITMRNDSIFMKMPFFDSEIKAKVSGGMMQGEWINYSRKANQSIRFSAEFKNESRFIESKSAPAVTVSGKWETWFSPGTKDSSLAIGLIEQKGKDVTATFLTSTGDYRYLQGIAENDSLFLSCFDGSHAYLFKAAVKKNSMNGIFLSGNHWKENFRAEINEGIELPDPDSVTFLKPGITDFNFSFPDLDSSMVSLTDSKFQNKVVVIQLMGSWCPNCIDESKFFCEYIKKNNPPTLEIIGLAFEKTSDYSKAVSNVRRLVKRLEIPYTVLLAGNREDANQKLPMLNKVMGYPTTIFIDKQKKIRKIYTGFNGPATGTYYEKYVDDFDRFVRMLLLE